MIHSKFKTNHALVICNGEMPSKKIISPLMHTKPFIVCADGGANKALVKKIRPHLIIGDLDSITKKTRRIFSSVPIIHIPDQNSTDLEKALEYLVANKFTAVTIVGATGERPDHTFANFSILVKYAEKMHVKFLDDYCSVQCVKKKISFTAHIGQQISLMPMGTCSGITTRGLKYPLKNESLALGVREGSSNEAIAQRIHIIVNNGTLLLFIIHPLPKAFLRNIIHLYL